ncbi:uncharacterized protein SCHCODRAFT_02628113 [Schizophyllum commune H4-8]|uniref:Uncharacterized protein n=1 Tax=Schizophyllum commune (strain H4-8 / FGSC 9210) TaxID=578458 RepID=D8Q8D8_SCHCM|nr:uncharacterized protein SCHCODRAFT_02628113 [Schizophyllum commune H4-8]KAI5891090.1 hypothetical protein SCHCODRAFT_02628113 [Schizophyllum commune H4-8]
MLGFGDEHLGYVGQPQASLGVAPAHALDPHLQPHLAMDPRYGSPAMWGNAMG